MEQSRAVNALEPFVLLSKSATSPRAASDLVTQATSSPNTYVFAELLQTPNIQALRQSDEYSSFLQLLEIFAWGTFTDYQAAADKLPKLSAVQSQKLQQLSLLHLAREHVPLPYATITSELRLSSPEELESLVTSAIYASLLTGMLDPSKQLVYVDSIAPLRDLPPGSLDKINTTFQDWSSRCAVALAGLEAQEQEIQRAAREKAERQQRVDEMFEQRVINEEKMARDAAPGTRSKRGLDDKETQVLEDDDAMDVDAEDSSKAAGAKRVVRGLKNALN